LSGKLKLRAVIINQTILYDYEELVEFELMASFNHMRDQFYVSKIETNVLVEAVVMEYARLGDAWIARVNLALMR